MINIEKILFQLHAKNRTQQNKDMQFQLIGDFSNPHISAFSAFSNNLTVFWSSVYKCVHTNHLERIQVLTSRLVTGMCHLPCKETLQRLGFHSLQWRRLQTDLSTAFKIFTGLLDIDPNFPRSEPLPKERVGIFGEGCKLLD